MLGRSLLKAAFVAGLAVAANALAVERQNLNELIKPYKREPLQDIVCLIEPCLEKQDLMRAGHLG